MGTPAARQSTEQIYRALRGDILGAALRPGEAMSEARMAVRFGVSRTPVREAFKRLVEEGFLSVVPQVGTFVAPIDIASVHDSQFVRETLECRTVILAARHIDDAGRATLERHILQQERDLAAGDQTSFFRHDDEFHAEISRLAGHPAVWSLIESVKAQLDRVRCLSLESATWPGMIMREHRGIAESVMNGNEAQAEKAMRAHLRTVFAAIENIARSHVDAFAGSAPPVRLD
ncbi:GntR family transcriptional regulator [Bosea sp. NBC_00550]|jgi:DNA-binding GntR family transcriptional regulator|uniref:GntR family transcriptional regulator n=1 Tax=Bosea sp. NBC_00550 TaxID=2969621 RepID=UPI00222FBD7A|nr:GntR family transcriptional regulator [Bosea sp. NBC_00550]UZF92817.1 GntR family transcriptional regulator [Bosea sp. NBC_00550]